MKKFVAFFMALTIVFSLVGCAPKQQSMGDGDDVVLNFQLHDLGYGTQWLDETCDTFMEMYKDKQYGSKTGVFCRLIKGTVDTAAAMADSDAHIYFDAGSPSEVANSGNILCLDDLIKADVYETGPSSIEDMLWEDTKANFIANDGKYYGLPTYATFTGVSYDKHLFDVRGYYFARPDANPDEVFNYACDQLAGIIIDEDEGTELSYNFVDNSIDGWEANRSCGPDGKFNTLDDGLPSSLFEFITLCAKMSDDGVQPLQLAGEYANIYGNVFLDGLVYALLGEERGYTTRSLQGEVEAVVGFSEEQTTTPNGKLSYRPMAPNLDYIIQPVTKIVNVTEETGFYTQWSMERYYTMCAMEILKREGWMAEGSDPNTKPLTHLTAQNKFIHSGYKNMVGDQPEVGMLQESSYWYNESNIRGNLPDFYMYNPECTDREVRWMSLPCNIANSVTGEDREGTIYGITESLKGEKNTIPQSANNTLVINKKVADNPEVYEAFVDWLYFFYSQETCAQLVLSQGMNRAFDYQLPAEKKKDWFGFYSHLNDLIEESAIIFEASSTPTYDLALRKEWGLGEGGQYFSCCYNFGYALMLGVHYAREGFLDMMWTPEKWKSTYYKGDKVDEVKYLKDEFEKDITYVKPWYDVV